MYQNISSQMKSFTTKYACDIFATVEMNKSNMYLEANDPNAIAECAALQYDANMIMYIWNELHCLREAAILTEDSFVMEYNPQLKQYLHRPEKKPILKVKFLKNKLSEFKRDLYFSAHPELAMVIPYATEDAISLYEGKKEEIAERKAAAKAKKAAEGGK
jgi:hypothetical protein